MTAYPALHLVDRQPNATFSRSQPGMTPEQFLQLAKVLPEAMLLVTSEGEVLANNKPAAALIGGQTKNFAGQRLQDLVSDTTEHISQYLQSCARSRQLVLGSLTVREADGQEQICRVEGAVVRPWSPEAIAVVMLRLELRSVANAEFTLLNQKIDELTREVYQRQQAQVALEQTNQSLQDLLKKLQATQLQLVQTEKMSSLGQLVAGIAHEVNNPINFIHGNLTHAQLYFNDLLGLLKLYEEHYPNPAPIIQMEIEALDLDFLKTDLSKLLKSMSLGTDRIREIVKSLRTFSRLDEAAVKRADIHEGLDSTLVILQSRLKAAADQPQIQVTKNYGVIPPVDCYPGQLNQVFMNLIANAIDAVREARVATGEPPQICISTTRVRDDWVAIAIADNGSGIPEAVRQKIFDPFFTTKPVGKGTGLGLSISYQIVTDVHGGILHCESQAGQGTTFTIEIPIHRHLT